jgi:chromate reductase, NAD(P)H dehydrogenase (quinone)
MAVARPVRVVAISGSLRRASSNSALIAAAVRCTPPDVDVTIYDELANIPPFNQDLDTDTPPDPVRRLRAALDACDALVISSPEYAHGVPGVLKNALDWVVGSGELIDKPVALINASARATHAWHALVEILTTMSARVIREASITIPVDGSDAGESGLFHSRTSQSLRAALDALANACAGLTPKE